MTTKLSDTQLVILSAACSRDDHAVFPITASLKGGALDKVLRSLIAKGLAEEVPAAAQEAAWRQDDDGVRLTLRATPLARQALGIGDDDDQPPPGGGAGSAPQPRPPAEDGDNGPPQPESRTKAAAAAAQARKGRAGGKGREKGRGASVPHVTPEVAKDSGPRSGTKQALLIEMLRRPDGATVDEIVAATGWLPHTVRGAMAGALKKKLGLTIESAKEEGRGRAYRIKT
jgi:hypothetical protein